MRVKNAGCYVSDFLTTLGRKNGDGSPIDVVADEFSDWCHRNCISLSRYDLRRELENMDLLRIVNGNTYLDGYWTIEHSQNLDTISEMLEEA